MTQLRDRKPVIVKDLMKANKTIAEYSRKWGIAHSTVSKWAREVGVKLPKTEHAKTLEERMDVSQLIHLIGKWTDTDLAKKFGVAACSIRSFRERQKVPPVPRPVFISRAYREARLEFLQSNEYAFNLTNILRDWKRPSEVARFVEELKCASIRSRLASY